MQVKQISNGKLSRLTPPLKLNSEAFEHRFEGSTQFISMVSLAPLFKCLNDIELGTKKKKPGAKGEEPALKNVKESGETKKKKKKKKK